MIWYTVCVQSTHLVFNSDYDSLADFLLQSGLANQVRFHGKRYPWFVSDVTRKDWSWLLNTMVYGQLFPKASEEELESLRRLGARWKVRLARTRGGRRNADHNLSHSNMKKKANGSTNNIHSGVLGIRTGICILKLLICSSTCHGQILSFLRGILIIAS